MLLHTQKRDVFSVQEMATKDSGENMTAQARKLRAIIFSAMCCRNATRF
jgi:hypothetical protein